jgi:hypothetical protein
MRDPRVVLTSLALVALAAAAPLGAVEPLTVVETTSYARTSLHQEVVDFVFLIQAKSELVTVATLTTTAEGRMVPLVILSKERVRTPYDLRRTGKPAVLVMANIHAGEVEGKEACMMLIRDVALGDAGGLLDTQVILVIPIFNADGNDKLGKNRRDKGPELAGVRFNGQNLDLNRDYVKLDSPEVRALVRLFTEWDPILFLDMHTTNGSYHREPVTYCTGSNPNGAPALADYMWKKLFPAAARTLLSKYGYDSVAYGEFGDRAQPEKGWVNDTLEARYGTNYLALRNRFSILNENYSYADFKTRVLGSYAYVRALLEYTSGHGAEMVALARAADAETVASFQQQPFVLESRLDKLFDVTVKGYEYTKEPIKPEDKAKYPAWYGDFIVKPTDVHKDYTVPYLALATPTKTAPQPRGYVVLPFQDEAVATLKAHGIQLERLGKAATLDAERYVIEKIEFAKNLFQGRIALTFTGHYEQKPIEIPAGSYFVDLHQPLGRLVPIMLEPGSVDSLAAWGFFNRVVVQQWSREPGTYPVLRIAARPPVPLVLE